MMKKSLIYLIIFCLAFCLIFTACATRRPQNHDGSQSTTDSKSSATKETTESTSQQTTEQSSATEITTQTTKQTKPYEVCNTKIRETKALQTEIPELQEKVDMNVETEGKPKVQQKVMLTFGDHRDVPYLFHIGANTYVEKDYLMIWDPGPSPSLYDLQSKEEYMPVYTYTGTETIVLELNDEICNFRYFNVISYDNSIKKIFFTFEEMYKALPKGKYYVYFYLTIYGNDIIGNYGYVGREEKGVIPAFIVELK